MQKLAEIFILNRHMFMNLLSWIVATLKFLLFVHYYACGWLWMQNYKEARELNTVGFSDDTDQYKYVDSVYLLTTTITTVGYGDFKAFVSNEPVWEYEMLYLYFVTLGGITLFSSVTNEIFSYKKLLTAREIIN